MTFLKSALLSTLALAALTVPATAHAITVECELKDGSTCTVSNDPVDSVSCACANEAGTGSSGDDTWADFDEEMLLEVCEAELEFCNAVETGGMTTGMTTSTTTAGDTGGGDTGGDGTGTSGVTTAGGTSGGDSGGGSDSSTGGSPGSGDGPSTDPAETTGSSASGGDDGGSTSTTGAEPQPGGDGSSSGADETSEDPSGCSVHPQSHGGALMALFGLVLGIRRRRVREA